MAVDLNYQVQHYLGNPKLKRANVNIPFTKEQIIEYKKCSMDPIYFTKNYVKIINIDEGLVPFDMYPYQRKMVKTFAENRYTICKLPRQSGKTTTVAAYVLWVILFHELKNVAILANKGSLAREILERIKNPYENLPLWMQQGVTEWNKGSIELENGSKVIASSTTSSAVRGSSYTHLILDEFAFVPTNIAEDFMRSVYPTISSGKKSKVIIVSTPNGMNHFYKSWMDSVDERSDYANIDINWNEVPGRDLTWKKQQIRNIGQTAWNQEFEGKFLGSSNTLISGSKLNTLRYVEPLLVQNDVTIYEKPKLGNKYVMMVDTSRGVGGDYSAFVIIDISETPYRVVALYRNNLIQPIHFTTFVRNAAIYYNKASMLVEINDIGAQVADIIKNDLGYDNILSIAYMGRVGQTISGGFAKNSANGLRMTQPVKKLGCSNLKMLIEQDKLIINDFNILEELTTFVHSGGSYAADEGKHDDYAICLVIFGWMIDQRYLRELTDINIRKEIQEELKEETSDADGRNEDSMFFGFIDVVEEDESFVSADGDHWTPNKKWELSLNNW